MLGKLMKYDMRYMAHILPWIYLGGLGASALISTLIILAGSADYLLAGTVLFGFLFVIAVEAVAVCSAVFMMVRIYKNLFSDEGYLTFTLPVKNQAVVSSKILTGAIWTLISYAAIFIMLLLPYLALVYRIPGLVPGDILEFFRTVFSALDDSIRAYPVKTVVIIVLFILNGVAMLFYSVSLYTLCAAATHRTKKARGFASVAMFLGISFGVSIVRGIVASIVNTALFESAAMDQNPVTNTSIVPFFGIFDAVVGTQMNANIANLSVSLAFSLAVIIVSWCVSVHIVNKDLNLQ